MELDDVVIPEGTPEGLIAAITLLNGIFPIRSETLWLTLEAVSIRQEVLFGTVQLILWNEGSVSDIKEQQLRLIDANAAREPRLPEALAGWAKALVEAGRCVPELDAWVCYLPSDLWVLPRLLRLKRPQTTEQFFDAVLRGPFKRVLGS